MEVQRRKFGKIFDTKENIKGVVNLFIFLAVILIIAVFSFGIYGIYNEIKVDEFGSFVGGVLGSSLAFLTFMALLITIMLQHSEIKAQAFDTMFFQMLTIHNQILENMTARKYEKVSGGPDRLIAEWHGRDCFTHFYENFKTHYTSSQDPDELEKIKSSFNGLWGTDRNNLAPYFRFLKNMISVVHESDADNIKYKDLIRSQLSDFELLIIFYYLIAEWDASPNIFGKNYNMLEHLPKDLIIRKSEHTELYKRRP